MSGETISGKTWNPRYANYARAHGRTPEDQIIHDSVDWPGGPMAGFILWHTDRLREAATEIPGAFFAGHIVVHDVYDAWLTAWVDKHLQAASA